MTKSATRETADVANVVGRKNLIINGAMQVAQRGTSSTANGFVSLDRWYVNQSGASTTFSQETNTSPSETVGINNYARLIVSSSSDYTGISYKIENVTSILAGTVTLSFWAKGTGPVGGLYMYGTQDFGTSGSADVELTAAQITASLTSSWVRYSMQITIPSVDGKTINAGSFLKVSIVQGTNSSSTAYDLNITGVQLELGSVATDFEHRSYGEELALCQRFYDEGIVAMGASMTPGTASIFKTSYGINKRATPTMSVVSVGALMNFTGAAIQGSTTRQFTHYPTGGVTNNGRYVINWTADAEL